MASTPKPRRPRSPGLPAVEMPWLELGWLGWLRSIKNRLTLLFFAITLAAIAVVYVYVAPSLESSLRSQRLHDLGAEADGYGSALQRTIGSNIDKFGVDRLVREAAARANARVTLFGVTGGTAGLATFAISDSAGEFVTRAGLSFASALQAARSRRAATTVETTAAGSFGEAARPLFYRRRVARVVVFTAPLSAVQREVALIRREILIAGAMALALALLAGYLVARALSQRIKRLEKTAGRVAAGDFSARFPVDSDDELGQLANALDDMQRQLAELDNARKRFIATASHELRTPIFSLGGFLELIQDEELDDETRKQFVGQVREQVDRLGKLATGLLDLSRLEAGSLELHQQRTDIGQLARAVTSEFIPALAQHGSHLELRLLREPIPALCDPERVAQIMRILIDNAITHTPEGTRITVTAARHDGRLRLAVRDDGEGIERPAAARIFEPFYTSDGVQGSGLGLAIAHELAERLNGKLAVDSVPGRTIFTLDLPA